MYVKKTLKYKRLFDKLYNFSFTRLSETDLTFTFMVELLQTKAQLYKWTLPIEIGLFSLSNGDVTMSD